MVGVVPVSVSAQFPLHSINITNVFIVRNRQRQQWRHYAKMWQVIERIMPPLCIFPLFVLPPGKLFPLPLFLLLYAQVALLFVFPACTLILPDVCVCAWVCVWCLAYCRCCTPSNKKKQFQGNSFSGRRPNTLFNLSTGKKPNTWFPKVCQK